MNKYYICSKEISWQLIGNVIYIFNEKTDEVHTLKKSAVDFWIWINKDMSLLDTVNILEKKYNVSKEILTRDILSFVESLTTKNVLLMR